MEKVENIFAIGNVYLKNVDKLMITNSSFNDNLALMGSAIYLKNLKY